MRLGTRRSALALAQAREVAELIGGAELVPMATRGDRDRLSSREDKSRWVADLEDALVSGEIDLAVHSAKDVPAQLPAGLALLGAPARAAAADVLCGARDLAALPPGASVGTSSIRRAAQLRAARSDIEIVAVRGNVDTRLARLQAGELDALVLARAGLQRLGREDEIGAALDERRFVPAPGQGVVVLEGREDDESAAAVAAAVSDTMTLACLRAERALAAALEADCDTPLGGHCIAVPEGGLVLRAWVGLPDGSEWITDERSGAVSDPDSLAGEVAARLRLVGVSALLDRAHRMAAT